MDLRETDEQQLLRKSVAAMAGKYGHEYLIDKARTGGKTTELWKEAGDNGYLGVAVPAEYGGGGAGMVELSIVAEEIAAAGCPLLLIVVSPAIAATVIATSGTTDQKEHWLPRFADGSAKMSFAITEPDAGSNSHRITTTARRGATPTAAGGACPAPSTTSPASTRPRRRSWSAGWRAPRGRCARRCSSFPPTPPAWPTSPSRW